MDKFDVKIRRGRGAYYLSATRNGRHWSGVPIDTPSQMRKMAEALISKANELEKFERSRKMIMNELKELIELGWIFSACYNDNEFYLVATFDALDIVKSAMHADLEMAVTELCIKCEAVNDLPIATSS